MSETTLQTDQDIEQLLSQPTPGAIAAVEALDGDYMVLGVGGKMGTSLAVMIRRALDAAGKEAKVYGVSRFSRPEAKTDLEALGIIPVACDLADPKQVEQLPDVKNVQFLAPPLALCTDNAAMIAYAGLEKYKNGHFDDMTLSARPRWPLDRAAAPMIGSGKKGAKA